MTTSLRHNHQGFTLIELLILVVIVGILGTLVATTYSGIQTKNRNNQRQTSIKQVQSELEAYYAQNSMYPTLAQLNDSGWLAKNMKDLNTNDLRDPSWSKNVKACAAGDTSMLIATTAAKCYTYQVTGPEAAACDNTKVTCAQYTLTAMLEGGEKYVKSSLN
jgi:prepilin-type N-terminal cleavage/methylation domain-containing protein